MITKHVGFCRLFELNEMRNNLIDAKLSVKEVMEDTENPKELKIKAMSIMEDIEELTGHYSEKIRECKTAISQGIKAGDIII